MNRQVPKRLKKKFQNEQTIANQELEIRQLKADIVRLKEIIACCRMAAIHSNDREMVDLTSRALGNFKRTDQQCRITIQEYKKK